MKRRAPHQAIFNVKERVSLLERDVCGGVP
jgi:hypothetical protein